MGQSRFDLEKLPAVEKVLERLRHFPVLRRDERLSPDLAARLYGPILRTSVSRIEQFAACPFRFFIDSGLRAQERKSFELDLKEQGTFQHDLLALFHQHLAGQNKRWRDITPEQARALIARLAANLSPGYRDGLLYANEQSRFLLRVMTESLQDFVETLVTWMRGQYEFDPVAVELAFGETPESPTWSLDLSNGHSLALRGRIDRIDLHRDNAGGAAHCVVLDYKSRSRELEPLLIENGVQLQLLTYLNVVRRAGSSFAQLGNFRFIPSGVFYVSLRGNYPREQNRRAALSDTHAARQIAYRHSGRFCADALRLLDSRPDARAGDQFNYRVTNSGKVHKGCREALEADAFERLLDGVEANLKEMGRRIYSGAAEVDPYRTGTDTACHFCAYRGICRIDPWTHRYRVLKQRSEREKEDADE
jgi:ATP-dependent helicase/nuclease subunit B